MPTTVPSAATPFRTATDAPIPTPLAPVESMHASVVADLLSCRYGPGPEYLYLYALRKGANVLVIGRTDNDQWHWVYVEGTHKCWVNVSFLHIDGNWKSLPIVYPGVASLPVTPFYPPTAVTRVTRQSAAVEVRWLEIPLRPGDEEDAGMQHYIVELWRCEGGTILFEPIATNNASVVVHDESGCAEPSHGRIFVQEKHGFSGPAEIPWPLYVTSTSTVGAP